MKRLLVALLLLLPPPCSAYQNGVPHTPLRCVNEQGVEVSCDDLKTPVHYGAVVVDAEVAFSPNRGATQLVVKTIESAHQSIRMAAYSFTSKPIAQALLDAHKNGIDVRVVVDKSQATARYTAATFLANQGVPVRVDYRYAIMHDKFIVVDGVTVEEGSFNYTAAAESRNAENVLVLHDPAVAAEYGREWDRLWAESEGLRH